MMSKNYFNSIAIMVGTIIGVGMFAVPFVVYKSGVLPFLFYLPVLAIIKYYIHNLYAQIILSTKHKHRVPGYVGEYFGRGKQKIALVIVVISISLSSLAYLIVGGIFLNLLLGTSLGGNLGIYTFVVLLAGAFMTIFGVNFLSKVELVMSALLFAVIGLIVYKGIGHVEITNYTVFNPKYIFTPYGPIFFAIGGASSIPVVCKLLAHKKDNIKSAIFWGSAIPVVITGIFALIVIGITGSRTSPESLVGLEQVLGNGVVKIAVVFGLISIITSFIMSIEAIKEVLWWDMKLKKIFAWAIAVSLPYALYLVGLNNLTKVVSLTGATIGGVIGTIYLMLGFKVQKNPQQKSCINVHISKSIALVLSLVFLLGFIYELVAAFN